MGRRWLGVAGIVLGLVVTVGACKTDADSEPTTVTRTGPRASLQFRPVEVMLPPGGDVGPGPGSGSTVLPTLKKNGPRYQVGPVALTERGVSDAEAVNVALPGQRGWAVNITLNRDGIRAFNELAAELYPKSPPQNSVAIVVNGQVQSAPAFMTDNFEGGEVQISRVGSEKQAQTLAAALRP